MKLYEYVNIQSNSIILLFPLEQIVALRISAGTSMTVQLPPLTANERGMVFTFVKYQVMLMLH